jgi:hypothetical protein
VSEYEHILVAIHGIGEQSRNMTVRAVATRLALSAETIGEAGEPVPLAPQPLGWFYSDVEGAVKVAPLDAFDPATKHSLAAIGFTEVFWADIPQEVVKEGRTIEETKAWARTVVGRARYICNRNARARHDTNSNSTSLREPDFSLAAEVLEEIIDTIHTLENLTFLADKAGVLKFDLNRVLEEYLGDVQIVTEFTLFRNDIIGRFHSAMQQIHTEHPKAKLHIVAHSEGTVVSFLGLLHALSGERVLPAKSESGAVIEHIGRIPSWLTQLRGYLTIGSPIDKHILLWPGLFKSFDFEPAGETFSGEHKIKWRNYYDYGDPVGFKLDAARTWLKQHKCEPFEFQESNDIGFARYALPGKAHNDYWEDGAVFEHFIRDVIKGEGAAAPEPKTRPIVYVLSPTVPYVVSFLLLALGVFVLYRAVTTYTHPDLDHLARYIRYTVLGLSENKAAISSTQLGLHALEIAGFIAGITLLARLPRLAEGMRWLGWGFLAFLAGCASYCLVAADSRLEIGQVFEARWPGTATIGVLVLGFLVAFFSLLFVKKPSYEFAKPAAITRKQRWIFRGMRPLLLAGALAVALLVVSQMLPHSALFPKERDYLRAAAATYHGHRLKDLKSHDPERWIDRAHLNRDDLNMLFYADPSKEPNYKPEHVKDVTDLLQVHPPGWMVILSGLVFLYFWWLAALLFDLAFVWQRYVRNSVVNERLKEWQGIGSNDRAETIAGAEPAV